MTAAKSKNQTKSTGAGAGRGGRRPGSGRKPGSATKKTREIADKAAAAGITPLEFMLNVMLTEPPAGLEPREAIAAQQLRFEAAKAAAPYVHPRLASVEHTGPEGGPVQAQIDVSGVSTEALAEIMRAKDAAVRG